jgi:hypothetical protein
MPSALGLTTFWRRPWTSSFAPDRFAKLLLSPAVTSPELVTDATELLFGISSMILDLLRRS